MDLAPDATFGTAMLARSPLALTLDLDPSSVDQEMQRALRAPMRDVHGQRLLPADQGAEVGHIPVQANQPKQALDESASPWSLGPVAFPWLDLPQRHPEQDFHGQAGLDGGVTVDRLSPTLASGLRSPNHVGVEPHRQRSTTLERLVTREPVQGSIGRCVRSAHPHQLSSWIHNMNPLRDLCNRAHKSGESDHKSLKKLEYF